jgi:hypothetical protein
VRLDVLSEPVGRLFDRRAFLSFHRLDRHEAFALGELTNEFVPFPALCIEHLGTRSPHRFPTLFGPLKPLKKVGSLLVAPQILPAGLLDADEAPDPSGSFTFWTIRTLLVAFIGHSLVSIFQKR